MVLNLFLQYFFTNKEGQLFQNEGGFFTFVKSKIITYEV